MIRIALESALILAVAGTSAAQTPIFVKDQGSLPAGPSQTGGAQQVDLGDVDGDGDPDIAIATLGSGDADRLWINSGGAQGGLAGTFVDESSTRLPALAEWRTDVDFADYDSDGDLDLRLSSFNAASRFWINMGGAQGGTPGYFQDQTAARWLDLNAGSTSIWANLLLAGGGFKDGSNDGEFGDLDGDGDLDLLHTSELGPSRVFLNDGSGAFREFNPSGYRLNGQTLPDGQPGLWCEGLQQTNTFDSSGANCDIQNTVNNESEVFDFDGDFDLDLLQGELSANARLFQNRFVENGQALAFRDVTIARFPLNYAPNGGGYGQGVADLDGDDDVDVYALNWLLSASDYVLVNDGAGTFSAGPSMPASTDDEEDADFLDYDGDGDLDVLLAGYAQNEELYRNDLSGAGGFTKVSNLIQADFPESWDADVADTDLDGDVDFVNANRNIVTCGYFRNTSSVLDTHAPRIPSLQQAPDRAASSVPTAVRAQVYDNISDYVVATYAATLEYSVDGGAFASVPLLWMGAQIFRGEIPGQVSGLIHYRVRITDRSGNVGLSNVFAYVSAGFESYCTAGTSSNGCAATMTANGVPSASAPSGFALSATGVEGQKASLVFYGTTGRVAQPWGASSSYLCVRAPWQRTAVQQSGGSSGACDGALSIDWNAFVATHPGSIGTPFSAGDVVEAQAWYRDPPSPKTTALSNALEFVVAP